MDSLANQKLPIISLSNQNLEGGSSSWLSTSKDVVLALEEYGCFIATYTNLPPKLQDTICQASKQLFDLPTHIKMLNTSEIPGVGYVGKVPMIPLYETLGIENATTEDGVQGFINQFLPSGNQDSFREIALEYARALSELERVVMTMVSEFYGITNSYESLLEKTWHHLRFLKYRLPNEDETSLGLLPHTDKTFMTILHQSQIKGLEVKTKHGDWIAVHPSPEAFIVLVGDACMAWTNGRIESAHHRVIIDGNEDRYSFGLFTFIKDFEIQVPDELVDGDHPLQFKPFDNLKYIQFCHSGEERPSSDCPMRDYCGV